MRAQAVEGAVVVGGDGDVVAVGGEVVGEEGAGDGVFVDEQDRAGGGHGCAPGVGRRVGGGGVGMGSRRAHLGGASERAPGCLPGAVRGSVRRAAGWCRGPPGALVCGAPGGRMGRGLEQVLAWQPRAQGVAEVLAGVQAGGFERCAEQAGRAVERAELVAFAH